MAHADDNTVLVVDDEVPITELVAATLTSAGFKCATAHNGAQALQALAERETAFLLTDLRMPGMNGLDLLDQVRLHHPDTFVLLLTGAADVPAVVRAMRAGAADFMTKPFTLAELRDRMSAAHDKRRALLAEREARRTEQVRLSNLAERYRDLTDGVLAALTTALGAKHPETRAHSERVALLAADLASTLGVSRDDVRAIYVAGLLHDIGKVAVDRTLLDKPGVLDAREIEKIRLHPVESARIAEPIALSPVTLEAIRHHHERFDGTGYPDRLAGEQIPFPARVLAVCDAYDAMTHARAYQSGLAPEESIERLREGAGKQWDPAVVSAFIGQPQEVSKAS